MKGFDQLQMLTTVVDHLNKWIHVNKKVKLSWCIALSQMALWVHDPGCLHDPSAHAHNDVVENVTVSLHYWYHACDDTLDGQAAQLAAYFCRLHCVFH